MCAAWGFALRGFPPHFLSALEVVLFVMFCFGRGFTPYGFSSEVFPFLCGFPRVELADMRWSVDEERFFLKFSSS